MILNGRKSDFRPRIWHCYLTSAKSLWFSEIQVIFDILEHTNKKLLSGSIKVKCWFTNLGASWCNLKLLPFRGQGESEERERLPLQTGRLPLNKQGNSRTKLVLGGHMTSRSPDQNLESLFRSLNWVHLIFSSDSLNHTLLFQSCILKKAPTVGTAVAGRMYISRTEEGFRSLAA